MCLSGAPSDLLVVHPWLAGRWDYGSFVILFPLAGYLMRLGGQKRLLTSFYLIVCFAGLGFFSWQVFGFDRVQLIVLGGLFMILLRIFFVL